MPPRPGIDHKKLTIDPLARSSFVLGPPPSDAGTASISSARTTHARPTKDRMRKQLLVIALAIVLAACNSGKSGGPAGSAGAGGVAGDGSVGGAGGGSGTDGGAGACSWAHGTMTWLANGVPKCAVGGFASRAIGTGFNELLIVALAAGQNEGYVIDIDTMTDMAPHGTYVCQAEGGVMPYVYGGIPPVTFTNDCMITVDEAGTATGPNARGTFSGRYQLLDDSILEITNGVFDVLPDTPPP
jgi:hypothetical protein